MQQNELIIIKEIHTIRAENYEQTKELSPDERSRRRAETVTPIASQYGFRIVPIQKKSKTASLC
jgi:hypothetical protein